MSWQAVRDVTAAKLNDDHTRRAENCRASQMMALPSHVPAFEKANIASANCWRHSAWRRCKLLSGGQFIPMTAHNLRVKSSLWSFRSFAAPCLSAGEMSGFWLRPDGSALYANDFGSMDSQSKRQELLIEFLEVLKLINEVVRFFRHCCSCLSAV
jgi:hypothetical protein